VEKSTQLNPWTTFEKPFWDFTVIPGAGQLLHGNVDPIFFKPVTFLAFGHPIRENTN
jgi:hypothetical protein